jgi:hypothetical protein
MPTYDPLNQLTIAELDMCSRLLKTDIVTAIHGASMHRWAGMAIVAYVIAKRADPAAKLDTYRQMTPAELTAALGYPGDAEDPDPAAAGDVEDTPDPEPADPEDTPDALDVEDAGAEPAGRLADLDEIRQAASADPMAPTRA